MKILAAIAILGWASLWGYAACRLLTVLAVHYWPVEKHYASTNIPLANPWAAPGHLYLCEVSRDGQRMDCSDKGGK